MKYARDLSGKGSSLNGGRWNHKWTPCVYTSASRALAILEYTANVNIDDIPRALCLTTIEIPDRSILNPSMARLPGNWNNIPGSIDARDFGTALLRQNEYAAIKFPSVIIPEEFNFILNPLHPLSSEFSIAAVGDFVYDLRLKLI